MISTEIHKFVSEKKAFLLESLAENLCQFLFYEYLAIAAIDLKIAKPTALPLADFAAVQIFRSRSDYPQVTLQALSQKSKSFHNKFSCSFSFVSEVVKKEAEDIYIGIGTNLGLRAKNICQALDLMTKFSKILKLSFLYETNPKYVTNQPKFLNCVCKVCPTTQQACYLFSPYLSCV